MQVRSGAKRLAFRTGHAQTTDQYFTSGRPKNENTLIKIFSN